MMPQIRNLPAVVSTVVVASGIIASYAVAQYQISELRDETQAIKAEMKSELMELQKRATLNRESIVGIEADVRWMRLNMEKENKLSVNKP